MVDVSKAGSPNQFGVELFIANGDPVVYANKTAFEAAGWSISLAVLGVEEAASYTISPSPTAALASTDSLLTVTLPSGTASFRITPPTDFSFDFSSYINAASTAVNNDDINSTLLSTQGQPLSQGSSTSVRSFSVIEGDSFISTQFTIPLAVFTNLGMDAADLDDPSVISHEGQVRLSNNAEGIPNAYVEVCFISEDGTDAIFTIGWGVYPAAISGIQEGMELVVTSDTVQNTTFNWDMDSQSTITVGTISAATSGAGGTLTFPATCWSIGQTFSVDSGANLGDYTTASYTQSGSDVTVTVLASETIPSATPGGDVVQVKTITSANGSIAVSRQETRRT